MASFLDVCRFTPTAGGTTDWTFSAAVLGYQSPSAAGVVNGTLYKYRAESADLTQWELGEGAYTTGTGVLARTTVLFNSFGNTSKVNFTVAPQVAVVALAEDLPGLALANTFTQAQTAPKFNASASSVSGGQFDITGVADVSIANAASATVTPSVGSSCGFVITLIETALTGVAGMFLCVGGSQPYVVFSSSANLVSGVNIAAKVSLGWDGTQFTLYNNSGAGTLVFRLKTERML